MKIICWNSRGIGGGGKIGVVREMMHVKNVCLLGLVETKMYNLNEVFIRKMWGPHDCNWAVVNAVNSGGVLACIWDKDFVTHEEIFISGRWICLKGIIKQKNFECVMMLVYGPHSPTERRQIWKELMDLKESLNVHFSVMGDFNEVLKLNERNNGW